MISVNGIEILVLYTVTLDGAFLPTAKIQVFIFFGIANSQQISFFIMWQCFSPKASENCVFPCFCVSVFLCIKVCFITDLTSKAAVILQSPTRHNGTYARFSMPPLGGVNIFQGGCMSDGPAFFEFSLR